MAGAVSTARQRQKPVHAVGQSSASCVLPGINQLAASWHNNSSNNNCSIAAAAAAAAAGSLFAGQVRQQGDGLDCLAQPHLVSKDACRQRRPEDGSGGRQREAEHGSERNISAAAAGLTQCRRVHGIDGRIDRFGDSA